MKATIGRWAIYKHMFSSKFLLRRVFEVHFYKPFNINFGT